MAAWGIALAPAARWRYIEPFRNRGPLLRPAFAVAFLPQSVSISFDFLTAEADSLTLSQAVYIKKASQAQNEDVHVDHTSPPLAQWTPSCTQVTSLNSLIQCLIFTYNVSKRKIDFLLGLWWFNDLARWIDCNPLLFILDYKTAIKK